MVRYFDSQERAGLCNRGLRCDSRLKSPVSLLAPVELHSLPPRLTLPGLVGHDCSAAGLLAVAPLPLFKLDPHSLYDPAHYSEIAPLSILSSSNSRIRRFPEAQSVTADGC